MSILWCGGEPEDFLIANGYSLNDSSGWYRSDFSRIAVVIPTNGILASHPVTPFTSAWLSFYARVSFSQANTAIGMGFRNSTSGEWVGIGGGSVPYRMGAYKWTGSGAATKLTEEVGTSWIYTTQKYDIQLSSYGTNGTINVFVNGLLIITYTGNLVASSETDLDQIYITSTHNYLSGGSFSEIILADEDTRGMSLKALSPNAAGDTNDWNNGYDSINLMTEEDIIPNRIEGIYTEVAEDDFQCNLTGMPATGDFNVVAVGGSAYVSDSSGSLDIQLGMKTNSDIDLGSTESLDASKKSINKIWHTNPITTDSFTPSEIDSLQAMVRSK